MKQRPLGGSGLSVSVVGLGTMTWGEQNTEREAHEQLDTAVAAGVNFVDAAEMYPVPPKAGTQGRTEQYLGSWLKARGTRDQVIVATKVTGPADMPWLRGGPRPSRAQVRAALEASLRRLQTDHVDLYQVHWPDRSTNFFGKLGYVPLDGERAVPIEETLEALAQLVKEGKARHAGISNETPWGLSEYLRLARERGWPRVCAIQNPYNLLNRSFEVGLAEFAHREQVGLLAYSPLAFGVLSGKYLAGARPAGARLTLFSRFQRYTGERVERAVEKYVTLARAHGLDPAQMALAYVCSRPFVASVLVGATKMAQLRDNLAAAQLVLSPEVIAGIEGIHRDHSNPAP
jgi:aryl-alcohol dehydrogenase-like predicted oxidoreductase